MSVGKPAQRGQIYSFSPSGVGVATGSSVSFDSQSPAWGSVINAAPASSQERETSESSIGLATNLSSFQEHQSPGSGAVVAAAGTNSQEQERDVSGIDSAASQSNSQESQAAGWGSVETAAASSWGEHEVSATQGLRETYGNSNVATNVTIFARNTVTGQTVKSRPDNLVNLSGPGGSPLFGFVEAKFSQKRDLNFVNLVSICTNNQNDLFSWVSAGIAECQVRGQNAIDIGLPNGAPCNISSNVVVHVCGTGGSSSRSY